MSSRRLEKVSKVIQATISNVIRDDLADPRVKGLISVTRVDVSPDLRNAKIYLSILGIDEKQQQLSLMGINHANGFIRSHLAKKMTMKTCPALIFYLDAGTAIRFETMQILNQISDEIGHRNELESDLERLESLNEEATSHNEK